MQPLSTSTQETIISMLSDGKSYAKIREVTGISIGSISKLCSQYLPTLSHTSGGCPKKLTPSNIQYSIYLITSGKAETAQDVTKLLNTGGVTSVSSQTVRRALKKGGMRAVVKKKRPLLSTRHRRERLDFALAHRDWTLEDWKKIIWSDETKIKRLGSDGRKWVWKKPGEGLSNRLVEGTVKFGGGSLMMWGCMLWEGPGYATRIEGKMDAELYTSILDDELGQTLDWYGLERDNIIFQQDNDPKHTSKKAKDWFKNNQVPLLPWPAQSPDLNPIEHLWDYLKKKMGEHESPPKGIHELWDRVQEEWNKIPASQCQKLIESMPRRVEAVIRAKGGYTKY